MRKLRIAFTLTAMILLGIDPASNARWTDRRGAINFVVGVIVLPFQLARLAAQRPDAVLLMPVAGAKVSRVADTWGMPRSAGRTHQGQDIFARKGTAVFSATGGYVVRLGRNPLGGNAVLIAGAGGRRYYYAHLEAFAPEMRVGKWVAPDTVIGFVGNTGNAAHTPPHLHFAVYTRAGAVNPLPLLRDRIPPSA
jgi:murein DD-endopeptidase MepM/ murein hydrolase activator NlpD